MINLRPYQHKFVKDIAISVYKNKRVIACLPTGGGKSKCFISIAQSALLKGKTVLIISESRKIYTQIHSEAGGIEIKASSSKVFGMLPNKLYIAMAQTLVRRPFLISQLQDIRSDLLIINDECHIGTSTKLLHNFQDAMIVGFTATPDFSNAKHLPELYNDCVIGSQVSDLIGMEFLTPYRHYARIGADLNKLKIKSGEFTESSQQDAFETKALFDGLVEDLNKISFKKAMIFCSSIAHCQDVFDELEFNGFKCAIVHSKIENCAYELGKFENGDCNICVTVSMLNKGYDFPAIDLCCLLFATTSLPRYLQSIGRGSRIHEGKEYFTVLDYGANYQRFGLWDMDREWDKLWQGGKKKTKETNGIAPVKMCPKCNAVIAASALVCQYCGELLTDGQQKELQEGELIEITEALQKMRGRLISTLSPEELATYAKMRNKKSFAIRIARAKEQQSSGYLIEYARHMNYKSFWVNIQLNSISDEKIDFYDIVIK